MIKKPNIAVIAGGDSSEFVVSIKSGANIFKAINITKFTPWLVQMQGKSWEIIQNEKKIADIDKSDFSFIQNGKKIKFSFVYITIHGTPGENGILQGYFELLKIPYSTSSLQSSSLTFNKWFCNNYLRSFGIKIARSMKISIEDKINTTKIADDLGLPLFVKPNSGGSSFGISKVKKVSEIAKAIQKAWKESNEVLVEQYIKGAEFTCGLVKINDKKTIFPVTEVLTKNEFFDFEAKYTPGAAEEITPARLSEELFKKCQEISSIIYDLCECAGIVRVDFILKNNEFYFLEINTTPGMTSNSFIPQQIAAMGLTLQEIITQIIEDNLNRFKQ